MSNNKYSLQVDIVKRFLKGKDYEKFLVEYEAAKFTFGGNKINMERAKKIWAAYKGGLKRPSDLAKKFGVGLQTVFRAIAAVAMGEVEATE